jgi:hypothetical protein
VGRAWKAGIRDDERMVYLITWFRCVWTHSLSCRRWGICLVCTAKLCCSTQSCSFDGWPSNTKRIRYNRLWYKWLWDVLMVKKARVLQILGEEKLLRRCKPAHNIVARGLHGIKPWDPHPAGPAGAEHSEGLIVESDR